VRVRTARIRHHVGGRAAETLGLLALDRVTIDRAAIAGQAREADDRRPQPLDERPHSRAPLRVLGGGQTVGAWRRALHEVGEAHARVDERAPRVAVDGHESRVDRRGPRTGSTHRRTARPPRPRRRSDSGRPSAPRGGAPRGRRGWVPGGSSTGRAPGPRWRRPPRCPRPRRPSRTATGPSQRPWTRRSSPTACSRCHCASAAGVASGVSRARSSSSTFLVSPDGPRLAHGRRRSRGLRGVAGGSEPGVDRVVGRRQPPAIATRPRREVRSTGRALSSGSATSASCP